MLYHLSHPRDRINRYREDNYNNGREAQRRLSTHRSSTRNSYTDTDNLRYGPNKGYYQERPENRRDNRSQDHHRKRPYREGEYYVENSRTGTSRRENNSDQHKKRNSTDSDHPKKRKTEEPAHLPRNNPTPNRKAGVGEPEANGSKEKDNKQRETENVQK